MNGQQNMNHNHGNCTTCCTSSLSWTAVICGALVGVGTAFLLNLFYIAIGLAVYSANPDGSTKLAIGGLLGLAIGTIATMFLMGWVAGKLGRAHCTRPRLGALYGFIAWCLALIITVILTTHIGRYVTSYSSYVTNPNPTVIMVTDVPSVAAASSQSSANNNTPAQVDSAQAAGILGTSAFIIFVLFALGALFSCLGGLCGMKCHSCETDYPLRK